MALTLPVLDLATPEVELVEQLREACSQHGFFLLTGHGVPQQLVSAALTEAAAFFSLPSAAKLALRHNQHAKGYMPWGEQTLDLAAQACGDTKETWAAMDEALSVAPADSAASQLPFHSPNQWPDEALLPRFRPTMQQLVAHMKVVRDRVNRLLAQALGQPPDFFAPFFATPLDMLRAFHYHSLDGSHPAQGLFAAGAHTDWGHVTYLMTDGVPGLQVYQGGTWHDVPHIPGAFVCNIADLLHLWSDKRFQSTKHRVVIAPGAHRFSLAYFTVPAWDAWVQPLQPPPGPCAAVDAAALAVPGQVDDTSGSRGATGAAAAADVGTQTGPAHGMMEAPGGVVVGPNGCSLAPGTAGVKVVDYMQAKYRFHFAGAGNATP